MRKKKQMNDELSEIRHYFIRSILLIGFVLASLLAGMFLGEECILPVPYFLGLIPITAYGFSALQAVLRFHPMDFKSMLKLLKGAETDDNN